MTISNYIPTLDEQIKEMEEFYTVRIGNAVVPAKISRTLKVIGWVLPGGKVVPNRDIAITVANNLNKLIKADRA